MTIPDAVLRGICPFCSGHCSLGLICYKCKRDALTWRTEMSILEAWPAYSRDYQSRTAVIEAWRSGADFQTPYGYISIREAPQMQDEGYRWLNIRYKCMSEVAVIPLRE